MPGPSVFSIPTCVECKARGMAERCKKCAQFVCDKYRAGHERSHGGGRTVPVFDPGG